MEVVDRSQFIGDTELGTVRARITPLHRAGAIGWAMARSAS
jgi:hypothetical protein